LNRRFSGADAKGLGIDKNKLVANVRDWALMRAVAQVQARMEIGVGTYVRD
jgi:hypothetical protein